MREKSSYGCLGILICALLGALGYASWNFCAGAGCSGGVRVLKLAHGLDVKHPVHMAMERMKESVERLSGGRMTIDIYPGGSLGDEAKCLEQIKNGSLDITKASSAQVGMFVPEVRALTLPYIYRDRAHYWRVLDGDIGNRIFEKIRPRGFVGLCYYDAGARSFYTSKKPIKTPEDLKGMKIRVMNSRPDMDMMSAFGASPTPISAGETYTALSQGIVEGAENNPPTYLTGGHWEVAKYFSLDEHTRIPDMLLISPKAWNSLTRSQRDILAKAARESSLYEREIWAEKTGEALAELKKRGVQICEPDKIAFAKIILPTLEKYKGTPVGEISEAVRNTK